jgi:hypothetical protein
MPQRTLVDLESEVSTELTQRSYPVNKYLSSHRCLIDLILYSVSPVSHRGVGLDFAAMRPCDSYLRKAFLTYLMILIFMRRLQTEELTSDALNHRSAGTGRI